MHYLAPGKENLVFHLTSPTAHSGRVLLHTHAELRKWTVEELEKAHKDFHSEPVYA